MSADHPRVAVCPGSYDPVTNGHLDVISRTSRVFDKVVVGVVNNPMRKEKTLFTAEERKQFIEDATAELGNVEVGIMSNLLVEFAKENGARAIIKGLRAISDFEYEFEMNQLNRKLAPDIESMYIFASPSEATSAIWCPLRLQEHLRKSSPARSSCVGGGQELAIRPRKMTQCPPTGPMRKL
jgi:pantetheine-phosphate adenylyltransferase